MGKNTLDSFRLDGQLVVITGGAGLLGRKHAEAILDAGGTPILIDVNSEKLRDVERDLKSRYDRSVGTDRVDITNETAVLEAKKKIESDWKKPVSVLINNAAIDPKLDSARSDKVMSRLENFPIEQWYTEIGVGLTGSLICAKVFGTQMAKNGKGVILNIASDLGVVAPDQRLYQTPGIADDSQNVKPVTYSVIKHGLIGLTKYLATYWADRGVRTNAFAPGGVFNNHPDEFVQKISNLIPMKRMADKDEYKAAVLFLCSDASSYMNGATLVMDGGRSIW